jgi:D-glycero-alpha-D-manno-heptose-7-phosphate kinase
MIVTRTPLRLSLVGGGTDFREFHLRHEGGVVTTAIDKYLVVTVTSRPDHRIGLQHPEPQIVDRVDDLRHRLVRECLHKAGITGGLDVTIRADRPSSGAGLGSSSTLIVGLLHALHVHMGNRPDRALLAREACEIEIDIVGQPIGIQDQYIAAYGGQRFLRFRTDGSVEVETLALIGSTRRALERNLMLFFTNVSRRSETILDEQRANIPDREAVLVELAARAHDARSLLESDDLDGFGRLLHEGWELKKQLASRITNPDIDAAYTAARHAGALGGKISGAGGGGFLLLYCPTPDQNAVRAALPTLPELPFRLESSGSTLIDCTDP